MSIFSLGYGYNIGDREICCKETFELAHKLNMEINMNDKKFLFRIPLGTIEEKYFDAFIIVPINRNKFKFTDLGKKPTIVKLLIKENNFYFCYKWGYQKPKEFHAMKCVSEDSTVDRIKQEIERLRDCVLKEKSVLVIQSQWRKCRYDPKYEMCEKVQMRNFYLINQ